MTNSQFSRSVSLNNIPAKKLNQILANITSSCEQCSNNANFADGLCIKCTNANVAINRFAESNIPIEYWRFKMDKDFNGYQGLLDKYTSITSDIKQSYIDGKSYCFAGNYGLGKTTVFCCVLKTAALKGYSCLYTTLSDVVSVFTSAPADEKYTARRELSMVDFLVIDELDSRFLPTESAADLYARTLENIFRTRSQNKLPTYICTNSPNIVEAFNGSLKASMDSLFQGYMEFVPVLGSDFRKNKA